MKKMAFALLIALVLLTGAVPAYADQPVVWYDGPFTVDEDWGSCSSVDPAYQFNLWRHADGNDKVTAYFDHDGVLVRVLQHDSSTSYFYSDTNPDYRLSGYGTVQIHHDFKVPGEWHYRYTGVLVNLQIAGEGTVAHQSGQMEGIMDHDVLLKLAGNVTYDFAELCAALAP
jgi:hypothetical protein